MNQKEYLIAKLEATLSPMEYMRACKEHTEDYIVMDVRNAPAVAKQVQVKGAFAIPLQDLTSRITELDKEKVIVVYCWDVWCNMATHASLLLLENGFKVKELSDGIAAWKEMKFPVEPCI